MEALSVPNDADEVTKQAIDLVKDWLTAASASMTRSERHEIRRLSRLITSEPSVKFTMQFCDRVARPDIDHVAAEQMARLARSNDLPPFLTRTDRMLFRLGGYLAPRLPRLVMPIARLRMRRMIGHLVINARPRVFRRHVRIRRKQGYDLNANLLGESVLGDEEAARRLGRNTQLLHGNEIDYISVKLSAVTSQLNLWAYEDTAERVCEAMRKIYRSAQSEANSSDPSKFVNLDMEEYRDLRLTIDAFQRVLSEPEFQDLSAGIVLQAYLPDSFSALQELVSWGNKRHSSGGGSIKIRLVKGANLAMETVDAELHGWPQAPYGSKLETDANYKRLLDWAMHKERLTGVRLGVASHNLFDVAWALLLCRARSVESHVDFEMLQGMAPTQAELLRKDAGGLLLYTPTVANRDFDTAIGYLFRRLEENSSAGNFLRDLFSLSLNSPEFEKHEIAFLRSAALRGRIDEHSYRTQDRGHSPQRQSLREDFVNEPDTDPSAPRNGPWILGLADVDLIESPDPISAVDEIGPIVRTARSAQQTWSKVVPEQRREILLRVAHEMQLHRADAIAALSAEGNKIFSEADVEVSEAIDFARYYANTCVELSQVPATNFTPLGTVVVTPPWNFPYAIAAGGVLAALAAGNTVVLKPAPSVPRCAALIVRCCLDAGVPADALQLVFCQDGAASKALISHDLVDGVILTGAFETAELFHSWRPELPLFGETSGKNALVITPQADIDLAVSDLVKSAFGHAGQKCSAASLAICVAEVYESKRFRRQLMDATRSLRVGLAANQATTLSQLAGAPSPKLLAALTDLSQGESWLVKPKLLDATENLWTPGIKVGVTPGSSFHTTECFGPVLGLMHAHDLTEAINLQNATPYGLTAGIHSLDSAEIDRWQETVVAGNLYVNRSITGAIVQRQPFGGWKASSVGPGAKAGGPNYLMQLGAWNNDGIPTASRALGQAVSERLGLLRPHLSSHEATLLEGATRSDSYWWAREFGRDHDPAGLAAETNIFRYRALPQLQVRFDETGTPFDLARTDLAALLAGVHVAVSADSSSALLTSFEDVTYENHEEFAERMRSQSVDRVRFIGESAADLGVECYLDNGPAILNGRVELLRYLREQSVSRTRHRFGNLVSES